MDKVVVTSTAMKDKIKGMGFHAIYDPGSRGRVYWNPIKASSVIEAEALIIRDSILMLYRYHIHICHCISDNKTIVDTINHKVETWKIDQTVNNILL